MFVGICVLGFKFNSISRGLFGVSGSDKTADHFLNTKKTPLAGGGGGCDAKGSLTLLLSLTP